MSGNHDDGSHHHHDHEEIEMGAALRVRAIEELMIAKGLINPQTVDAIVEHYERNIGPRNGAQVVAKAWTDPDFRDWLLRDGTAAINSLGFSGFQGEHIRVLENTDSVHHVVVCTLCSCYPWPVLGLPPAWYKNPAYRARVVREPRAVIAEFGYLVPDEVEVRVWDSTAEVRYLVIPQRPEGSENASLEQLAEMVTRDGMIGTARL